MTVSVVWGLIVLPFLWSVYTHHRCLWKASTQLMQQAGRMAKRYAHSPQSWSRGGLNPDPSYKLSSGCFTGRVVHQCVPFLLGWTLNWVTLCQHELSFPPLIYMRQGVADISPSHMWVPEGSLGHHFSSLCNEASYVSVQHQLFVRACHDFYFTLFLYKI